tara:strand:- start:129 stop:530 length:402 start_codon:yes stop_codon:yes gene_type:complete
MNRDNCSDFEGLEAENKLLKKINEDLDETNRRLEIKLRVAERHPCAIALANSPLFFEGEINKHLVAQNSALEGENRKLKAELEHLEGICNGEINEEMDAITEFIEVNCRRFVGGALRAGMKIAQKHHRRFQRH